MVDPMTTRSSIHGRCDQSGALRDRGARGRAPGGGTERQGARPQDRESRSGSCSGSSAARERSSRRSAGRSRSSWRGPRPDTEAIEPGPRRPRRSSRRGLRGPEERAARERQRALAERERGDPARDARTVAALEQQEKRVAEDREELDRRSEELASRAAELDAERERTAAGAEELETERQSGPSRRPSGSGGSLEESRDALREHERDLLRRENELELERQRTQAASDRAAETLAEAPRAGRRQRPGARSAER